MFKWIRDEGFAIDTSKIWKVAVEPVTGDEDFPFVVCVYTTCNKYEPLEWFETQEAAEDYAEKLIEELNAEKTAIISRLDNVYSAIGNIGS